MRHQIDNQYHYGVVYNLNGEIAGFNLSPDIHVPLTDDDIEKALEYYIELHCPLENEQGEKMTREEAIEQLEYTILLILQDGKDYMDERDIPVLKMAIQALKQQPKTECCDNCGAMIEGYAASNYPADDLYDKAVENCYEKWNRRAT